MALPASLYACILLLSFAKAQTDNGNECSCFVSNGSTAAYFTYHRFWDFRNVTTALTTEPNALADPMDTSNAPPTSSYFTDNSWAKDWALQSWNNSDSMNVNNATVLMINSPNNVFIQKSTDESQDYSSYLSLRTIRASEFQSAAEFDSMEQNFQYLSLRFLARVVGSPGACAGMFTYLSSAPTQEADIEILTTGPRNMVQCTNQPSVDSFGEIISAATVNATLPYRKDWSTWNNYRLDWMPTQSSWYVNGQSIANISFQVPRDPAGLIVNMWSDGSSWTGNMSLHNAAYLQIQHIELAYNTSGPYIGPVAQQTHANQVNITAVPQSSAGAANLDSTPLPSQRDVDFYADASKGCQIVCSIDDGVNASSIGTPVIVANNTSVAGPRVRPLTGWLEISLSGALSGALLLIGALFWL